MYTRQAAQVAAVNEMTYAPLSVLASDNEEVRAKGVVYAADRERLFLLCAYYMPALPEGMAYQVWLVRDGQRDSGGVADRHTDAARVGGRP